MRVVRHIREAKITHHILIYIEPKYYHIIKPDKMIGRELVHSMDACFCSAVMASRGVSFMSAHPDSSIIVFVKLAPKPALVRLESKQIIFIWQLQYFAVSL